MVSPPQTTKLYSEQAVWIATFLGSPLAGGILLKKNFVCFGETKKGEWVLWTSAIFTVVLFGSLFVLPAQVVEKLPNQIIPLVYTFIMYQLTKHYQGKGLEAHKIQGGEFYSAWNAAGVGAICLVGIFVVIFVYVFALPPTFDTERYEQGISEFSVNEEEALTLYSSLQEGQPEDVAVLIQQKGIPAWKNNMIILQELDGLENLPEELHRQNQLLHAYCKLRLEVYQLMAETDPKDTAHHNAQIAAKHAEIEAVLTKLHE